MLTERQMEHAKSLRRSHRCWRHLNDEQILIAELIYAKAKATVGLVEEPRKPRKASRRAPGNRRSIGQGA